MDLNKYYADIKVKQAELAKQHSDGCCFVTSVYNPNCNTTGGQTMQVTVRMAAVGIVEATHRLATPEEVASFKDTQEQARRAIIAHELKRKAQYTIPVDAEGVPILESPGGKRSGK